MSHFSSTSASREYVNKRKLEELASLATTHEQKEELHTVLKGIKHGVIKLEHSATGQVLSDIKVTWDEALPHGPQFRVTQLVKEGVAILDRETVLSNQIASMLNNCEKVDRERRRADGYPLQEQGGAGFVEELVSPANNPKNISVSLAHSSQIMNGQESLALIAAAAASSTVMPSLSSTTSSEALSGKGPALEPLRERPVLAYGFDRPRAGLIKKLKNDFQFKHVHTMNHYNEGVGIGLSLKFNGYCKFFDDVRNGEFLNRCRPATGLTHDKIELWAQYLVNNSSRFSFSEKLNSHQQRLRFFLKNYADIENFTSFNNLSEDLQDLIEHSQWAEVVRKIPKAFELLKKVGDESASYSDLVGRLWKELSYDERAILDSMVTYAFLRKTSKLGFSFAQEQGMVVVTDFNVPGVTQGDLDAIHNCIEIDPVKFQTPSFIINQGKPVPKAITFSEFTELGRLQQKGGNPQYTLITAMNEPPRSSSSSSKPQAFKSPGGSKGPKK